MKRKQCILFFVLFTMLSFTEEFNYSSILDYRLKNDSLFFNLKNNFQIAQNTYKMMKVDSYLSLDLTTGDINILLDSHKKEWSIDPSIAVKMPILNNLGIKTSFPYKHNGSDIEKGVGFDLFFDIYSQTRNKLKLDLSKANRNLELAKKKFNMQKLLIEKKLLTEIKAILSEYNTVVSNQLAVADANIKYRLVLAQGYGENSTKVRTAKLRLMQAERESKESEYAFETSSKLFLESFGIDENNIDIDKFFFNLAKTIPSVELINSSYLTESNYAMLINAQKDFDSELLQNKISLNTFSATSNTQFLLKNTTSSSSSTSSVQTISTGIKMAFTGFNIYTGIIIPTKPKSSPTMQLSFSFNPIRMYDYILMKKNSKLKEENAKIKLNDLKLKFKHELKHFIVKKEKLEWQQKLYSEEIKIYKKNANDHQSWFSNGIISMWENRQAELEYTKAVLRSANANIDSTIFNVELQEVFDIDIKSS